ELPAPLFRLAQSQAVSNISIGHAGGDAPPVGETCGVPPAILESFDQRARIIATAFEEACDADEPIGIDETSAAATGESCCAPCGIDDKLSGEDAAGRQGQPPFAAAALNLAKPCVEHERHAPAFGLACEHGVERGAVEVPAGVG